MDSAAHRHSHHPGFLKQKNKSHKHWHSSKNSIDKNSGKTNNIITFRKHKHGLSREERRNLAQQLKKKKRNEYLNKRRGICEAPLLVAILPLHPDINVDNILSLLKSADPSAVSDNTSAGYVHMKIPRLKQKFMFVNLSGDNLFDQLDIAKVCSCVLILASVKGISSDASEILESILAQGLPSTVVAITDLETLPNKKRSGAKSAVQQMIDSKIPGIEKTMNLAKEIDAMNLLRKIGSQKQRCVMLRDKRPHLLAEKLYFTEHEKGKGTLQVTGYLRGCNLSANSLVHITGWGEFQMVQIVSGEDDGEVIVLDHPDIEKQESLISENIPDPMDAEQTWPTEEEMCSSETTIKKLKKIPKGMSEYQAAWIPDEDAIETDDDDDDNDNDDEMDVVSDVSEPESHVSEECVETITVTSEAPVDPDKYDEQMDVSEENSALDKIRRAKEDLQFPDEVDTPQDIPAKDKFAKYRGLKSFRTSPWDPKENLPLDYAKIFQFTNFKRTKKAVFSSLEEGPVHVGEYITIYVKDVPTVFYEMRGNQPIVLFGMLPHEAKMSVVNMNLKRVPDSTEILKSKESLLFQVGYRRFRASPIYSEQCSGMKHKYQRFFQPESATVATVFAPVIFPPASILVFKENKDRTISRVAIGNVLSIDPDRVVLKRAVLSGHPFKVNKKSAVIRFMFFNREDILWFKPIELWTKCGRKGHIKDVLGTHGHMRCVFNDQLKSQDTVMMRLYKRVFPKWTYDPCVNFAPILN